MIRPIGTKIWIRPIIKKAFVSTNLIAPGSSEDEAEEGEVLAVGRGIMLSSGEIRPLEVKVGDIVLFGKGTGEVIDSKYLGREIHIIDMNNIIMIKGNRNRSEKVSS